MRGVAAFDFDGTLTRRDTLLPFLLRACGPGRTGRAVLAESVLLARGAAGDGGARDAAKAAVLGRLLAGRPLAELSALAETFADDVVARLLRTDAVARIEGHRNRGHELVIVSASPELSVAPVARRLAIDHVLGTRLEVDPAGNLTGRLSGANCRGAEKVVRLREWLGAEPFELWAYGDSAGDTEMLALAGSNGVKVGPGPRGMRRARRAGA